MMGNFSDNAMSSISVDVTQLEKYLAKFQTAFDKGRETEDKYMKDQASRRSLAMMTALETLLRTQTDLIENLRNSKNSSTTKIGAAGAVITKIASIIEMMGGTNDTGMSARIAAEVNNLDQSGKAMIGWLNTELDTSKTELIKRETCSRIGLLRSYAMHSNFFLQSPSRLRILCLLWSVPWVVKPI